MSGFGFGMGGPFPGTPEFEFPAEVTILLREIKGFTVYNFRSEILDCKL